MFRKISEGDVFTTTDPKVCTSGPRVAVLPDDTLLVTLWYAQNGVSGIRYVRLAAE